MSTRELKDLLEHVDDTRELVFGAADEAGAGWIVGELYAVWSAARAEANLAYDAWRAAPGREGHAIYLAAEDRADAAEDALAAAVASARPAKIAVEPVTSS